MKRTLADFPCDDDEQAQKQARYEQEQEHNVEACLMHVALNDEFPSITQCHTLLASPEWMQNEQHFEQVLGVLCSSEFCQHATFLLRKMHAKCSAQVFERARATVQDAKNLTSAILLIFALEDEFVQFAPNDILAILHKIQQRDSAKLVLI